MFHFSQDIIKKMKQLNIFKRKMNKRDYELFCNLEILCFIKEEKLKDYINYFKEKIFIDNNESKLIKYFENNWYKKK